jgi:hypothetical protein
MGINYRRFYYRILHRHPDIIAEVSTPGISCINRVIDLYILFNVIVSTDDRKLCKADKRLYFIAVIILIDDPGYFDYNNRFENYSHIRNGLRLELCKVLEVHPVKVSYILKNVRNYMTIYKEFRKEVDYFYRKMTE